MDISMLDEWEKEEQEYFATLGKEQPWDIHAAAYVELLQELRVLEAQCSNTTAAFCSTIPSDYSFTAMSQSQHTYSQDAAKTARLEAKRRQLNERYDRVLADVISFEDDLDLTPETSFLNRYFTKKLL